MNTKTVITNSAEETMALAVNLAGHLDKGRFIALMGDLGAGKTQFVKGIAKGIGVEDYQFVNSPSFVILKEYTSKNIELYHFDVYRLDLRGFEETLDYRKYFYSSGITVVEWADKIDEILPEEYLEIRIYLEDRNKRRFEISAVGEHYNEMVEKIDSKFKI